VKDVAHQRAAQSQNPREGSDGHTPSHSTMVVWPCDRILGASSQQLCFCVSPAACAPRESHSRKSSSSRYGPIENSIASPMPPFRAPNQFQSLPLEGQTSRNQATLGNIATRELLDLLGFSGFADGFKSLLLHTSVSRFQRHQRESLEGARMRVIWETSGPERTPLPAPCARIGGFFCGRACPGPFESRQLVSAAISEVGETRAIRLNIAFSGKIQ
jgi:hypothetical protein